MAPCVPGDVAPGILAHMMGWNNYKNRFDGTRRGADRECLWQNLLIVNGNPVTANVDPRTLLVQFLRENLRLTGTHVGCDTSQCGACVVHLDGKAVKSCTTLAVMADGHEVKTIEGLAADGAPLHPMQEAFREHHGLQCGFCTPGMIMTAIDIVHRKGHELDDHTIREELEGNLCRCTAIRTSSPRFPPAQRRWRNPTSRNAHPAIRTSRCTNSNIIALGRFARRPTSW